MHIAVGTTARDVLLPGLKKLYGELACKAEGFSNQSSKSVELIHKMPRH